MNEDSKNNHHLEIYMDDLIKLINLKIQTLGKQSS